MATSIFPSNTMSYSSSSTTYNKMSAAPGIKLAPLIQQASVVSYERRQGKMWFIIHVDPQQFNNLPTCLKRHPYTIARRYDDCVQFSQRLHDAFPSLTNKNKKTNNFNNNPFTLPKLKPQGLLNKKQPNGQRRAELDRFVQALFRLPAAITQTLIVLEFFGLQKGDTEQQVLRDKQNLARQHQAIINSTQQLDEDYSFFDSPFNPTWIDHSVSVDDASKWSSKFKSFRGRSPSSNSLSSFCSQAANRLPWSSSTTLQGSNSSSMASLLSPKKKPSFASTVLDDYSPPTIPTAPLPGLMSCSSSTTSSSNSISSSASSSVPGRRRRSSTRTSQSSSCGLPSDSSPTTTTVRTMKLKVIYDIDNIVVIQIPRSTNLAALRTRLHDKFSTMLDPSLKPLADQFVLLYNENTRSSSSELSLDQPQPQPQQQSRTSPSVTLISSEQHWAKAMKNWDALEKVTLRCIH